MTEDSHVRFCERLGLQCSCLLDYKKAISTAGVTLFKWIFQEDQQVLESDNSKFK